MQLNTCKGWCTRNVINFVLDFIEYKSGLQRTQLWILEDASRLTGKYLRHKWAWPWCLGILKRTNYRLTRTGDREPFSECITMLEESTRHSASNALRTLRREPIVLRLNVKCNGDIVDCRQLMNWIHNPLPHCQWISVAGPILILLHWNILILRKLLSTKLQFTT